AGEPVGKNYTPLSLMEDGGNDITYVESKVPADAIAEMEEVRAAIKAGDFEVPRNFDEPA
ncbi:MAG: BMP family ABC transporter substrate-binding protein, partial [Shimia sp.]